MLIDAAVGRKKRITRSDNLKIYIQGLPLNLLTKNTNNGR
jgi:hypothetical protein